MAESIQSFLVQYYVSMIRSPSESIEDFYNATSVIARQDHKGELNSTSTLEGIRDMIISSPHLKDFKISLVQEQNSTLDCVFVVAMGLVKDEEDLERQFVHSLYLVPSVWYTGGGEEGGRPYTIQNDTLLVLDSRNPRQQVTPQSKSQIEIRGNHESKYARRTYASVLGRKSPPGPGSFPVLSSSKGSPSSVAKRCLCAFVNFEEDNVKSSINEGIESSPDAEVAVSEFLKVIDIEVSGSAEGGCVRPVPSD